MTDEFSTMPRYVSHKQVWALEIATVGRPGLTADHRPLGHPESCVLTFRDNGFEPLVAPGEMFSRYKPVSGDFYVVYADGYRSFSPRKAFLEGYTRVAP
jgi:hypothetical protein